MKPPDGDRNRQVFFGPCAALEVCFLYPERQVQTVRKVYRFTVDVSDIVPVAFGPMRSWFTG